MNIINNLSLENIIAMIFSLIATIISIYYSNKNSKDIEILKNNLSENRHKFIKNYPEQRKIIKKLNDLFINIDKNFVNFYHYVKKFNDEYLNEINNSIVKYQSNYDDIQTLLKEKGLILKKSISNKSKNLIEEYDYVINEIQFSPKEALTNLITYKKKINDMRKDLENEFRKVLGSK